MKEIIAKHIGQGPFIPYKVVNGVLVFGDNELSVNLPEQEEDFPVHIDICEDEKGRLLIGASYRYVAQIDIHSRIYRLDKTGSIDETGIPFIEKKEEPFRIENVVLTLWSLNQ